MKLGIAALRSDEFEQGVGALRIYVGMRDDQERHQYCCLGVLTEVAIRNGLELPPDSDSHSRCCENCDAPESIWDLEDGVLSQPVREWYGLGTGDPEVGYDTDGDPITATLANDDRGWTFAQIADGFEAIHVNDADAADAA